MMLSKCTVDFWIDAWWLSRCFGELLNGLATFLGWTGFVMMMNLMLQDMLPDILTLDGFLFQCNEFLKAETGNGLLHCRCWLWYLEGHTLIIYKASIVLADALRSMGLIVDSHRHLELWPSHLQSHTTSCDLLHRPGQSTQCLTCVSWSHKTCTCVPSHSVGDPVGMTDFGNDINSKLLCQLQSPLAHQ